MLYLYRYEVHGGENTNCFSGEKAFGVLIKNSGDVFAISFYLAVL